MNTIQPESVAVTIEFEPVELLKEIVVEIINDERGADILGNAILDGTDQLAGQELAEILDEIVDVLAVAANANRDEDYE